MPQLPTPSQQAVLCLWYLVNMSLTAYATLISHFKTANQALLVPLADWQTLRLHKTHLTRFSDYIKQGRHSDFIDMTLQQISQGEYQLVFYDDPLYPATLKNIFDPPLVLFYQGNLTALAMPQLAIVGSRSPSPHASKIAFDIAQFLANEGLWITSGLAEGIDKQAHLGAIAQSDPTKQGRSVAVLGHGIRLCYPKHHQNLKTQLIQSGGCVVSEFLPDTPSARHNFPRRNRLVAGLSLATLVVEAALKSGSLITANCANDQGKQVFAIPSHIDNVNAKGCHQLIREGATLVDHPLQILEDLSLFKSPLDIAQADITETIKLPTSYPQTDTPSSLASSRVIDYASVINNASVNNTPAINNQSDNKVDTLIASLPPSPVPMLDDDSLLHSMPPYLVTLLNQLDWVGQDLDRLVMRTQTDIATLTGQLIELELMGYAMQQGGLFMRCRN